LSEGDAGGGDGLGAAVIEVSGVSGVLAAAEPVVEGVDG
jgi:hypothetical protein